MPITPAEQLAAQLREDIRLGRLRPGDQLPRDRDLVARHQISHSTVGRAIDTLRAEGLIAGRVGSGRTVLQHPEPHRDKRVRCTPAPAHATAATEAADRATATALGIDEGALVVLRSWVETTAAGHPVALRTTRTLSDRPAESAEGRTEDLVTARLATLDEANALRIDQTIPVLLARRTIYNSAGQPTAIDDTIAAGHRYELLYELPT